MDDNEDKATVKENTMMTIKKAENIIQYFWTKDEIKKCWGKLEP